MKFTVTYTPPKNPILQAFLCFLSFVPGAFSGIIVGFILQIIWTIVVDGILYYLFTGTVNLFPEQPPSSVFIRPLSILGAIALPVGLFIDDFLTFKKVGE